MAVETVTPVASLPSIVKSLVADAREEDAAAEASTVMRRDLEADVRSGGRVGRGHRERGERRRWRPGC